MTVTQPTIDRTHRSPNVWANDPARHAEAIVCHITDGTSSLAWLCSTASGVSAHYLIDRDGTIHELVDPATDSAWANGPRCNPDLSNPLAAMWQAAGLNPNHYTVSIEHEGKTSFERGGSLTAAQWSSSEQLIAWLCDRFGLTPDRTHIIGHYQLDSCTRHDCPGFSPAEWTALIAAVAAASAAPDERAALLADANALPLFARGNLLREGVVNLTAFGGDQAARIALFEKQYFHRLNGTTQCFFRDPSNPASYAALHAAGAVVLYGDGPEITQ
jgi:N-acetyl-anhydromuramyl-L-alanine amidase AmpD